MINLSLVTDPSDPGTGKLGLQLASSHELVTSFLVINHPLPDIFKNPSLLPLSGLVSLPEE